MAQWNMLYDMYERRLKAELSDAAVPAHIGVILDGNRRWAKSLGATASQGHRAGAGKISEFLQWSDDAGVSIVTLWLLSTDNLSRDAGELGELLRIICEAVSLLADQGRWKGSSRWSATCPCCPRRCPRTCVRPSRVPPTCRE